MLPVNPHREDIKAAIRKRGSNLWQLTKANKPLADTALTICLVRPLPRANKIIADFLGLSLNHLWPDWYDSNGKRISRRYSSKHSAKRPTCRSKKARSVLTKKGGAA